jgi:broad specificity phosphatase PhoE
VRVCSRLFEFSLYRAFTISSHAFTPCTCFVFRSEGNVHAEAYVKKPDHLIHLTPRGVAQSREAGRRLVKILNGEGFKIYSSPYLRARQTIAGLVEGGLPQPKQPVEEEPRLREQEFGFGRHLAIASASMRTVDN